MPDYNELITHHQILKKQLNDQQTLEIEPVLEFVKQARDAGSYIKNPQQREDLRIILRDWGAFVFEHTGDFPATQLMPYIGQDEKPSENSEIKRWLRYGQNKWLPIGGIVLVFLVILWAGIWAINGFSPMLAFIITDTPTPTLTPARTATSSPTPTDTSSPTITPMTTSPTSPCPPADAEGTIPPAVAIDSITFVVNGKEQVMNDANPLTATSGDQVQIKEVTICPAAPFEGGGGNVYVEFDPVGQDGQVMVSEVKGTGAVQVTPGLTTITGPDYTWTIDNWRHISVVTVHYPPGGGTQNTNCEGGACEIDDRIIVGIQ